MVNDCVKTTESKHHYILLNFIIYFILSLPFCIQFYRTGCGIDLNITKKNTLIMNIHEHDNESNV